MEAVCKVKADIEEVAKNEAQLARLAEDFCSNQHFHDHIVGEAVNAAKRQFDQGPNLHRQYARLITEADSHVVLLATLNE